MGEKQLRHHGGNYRANAFHSKFLIHVFNNWLSHGRSAHTHNHEYLLSNISLRMSVIHWSRKSNKASSWQLLDGSDPLKIPHYLYVEHFVVLTTGPIFFIIWVHHPIESIVIPYNMS